jgi:hypothetical protein
MKTSRRYLPKPLAPIDAARYLTRARMYRAQAGQLADTVGHEPNWPKHFLITHAIELTITAYLVFERGLPASRAGISGKPPNDHDLLALYAEAVRRGLKSDPLVLKDLPFLSDLHLDYYARYPRVEARPVPAHISDYEVMLDHLFADISDALGAVASSKHNAV